MQDIRRIIFNLRPMTLDDLGLVPTLKRYIEEFKAREGQEVNLEVRGEERRLDITYEVALFRLVQESLNNARKHAQAKKLTVKIHTTRQQISVEIADDGRGFDLKKVLSENAGKESFGLLSMKEKIELLKGELDIDSTLGKGTRIIASIPLEPAICR